MNTQRKFHNYKSNKNQIKKIISLKSKNLKIKWWINQKKESNRAATGRNLIYVKKKFNWTNKGFITI